MSWTAAAEFFGTDKGELGYMDHYCQMLWGRDVRRILEIGVLHGASLRMWQALFPDAQVIGVDNAPSLDQIDDLNVIVADATDPAAMSEIVGPFDLIVDDGSHRVEDISASLRIFADRLVPGGLYVVEDSAAHSAASFVAYWKDTKQAMRDAGLQIRAVNVAADARYVLIAGERP